LTSFFAFAVTATVGSRDKTEQFVLAATLEGAPEDRAARVLHALLDDPAKVLRFLRMLLSVDGFDAAEILDEIDDGTESAGTRATSAATDEGPLFESLLRTLDRDPERIEEVERLVLELRATEEGAHLLPPRFDEVWTPLLAAYRAIKPASKGAP
jgi:hypothetical protein